MDIKQILLEQLSGAAAEKLGSRNGLDQASTNGAMDSALTAILSGLQQEAGSKKGANKLDTAIAKDHSGSILDNLAGAVDSDTTKLDGGKILEHIFGKNTNNVTDSVAQNSGVSGAAASDILTTLAPIVLGQIGKQKQSEGLDVGGLVNILLGQKGGKGDGGLGDVVSGMFNKKNAGLLALILGFLKLFLRKKVILTRAPHSEQAGWCEKSCLIEVDNTSTQPSFQWYNAWYG
ncbi:DUF937 domain-containing protein [Candidatus Saccharibacteria bacterium]|nr:MAG: DUF937 domain-containing protein [Candidatus Saccharibacteria bacterium]